MVENETKTKTTRKEEVRKTRRRREGLGAERNLKLHVPEELKDKDFEYRWVNDRPGRVQQMTQMDDWDVVSTDQERSAEGTVLKRTVDSRIGEKAVLLRKRKEFYEADKAEEQKLIDAREETLRRGAPPSPEGLSGPESYVPGGKNIIAGR